MTEFTIQVIAVIKSIPPGKVMTYGRIAACCGSPRGARQVSRILHSMSRKYGLPWHRVISSGGEISLKGESGREQARLLASEGVTVEGRKIDLGKYLFKPE